MTAGDKKCLKCSWLYDWLPPGKRFQPRIPESLTAREYYTAAKVTVRASLTWLSCGFYSLFLIIMFVGLVYVLLTILPFVLFCGIGYCIAKRICCNTRNEAGETKENWIDVLLFILKRFAISLFCCIFLPVSVPMAVVLMLMSVVYLLMAGALFCAGVLYWCFQRLGIKKATTRSTVELPDMPVYNQTGSFIMNAALPEAPGQTIAMYTASDEMPTNTVHTVLPEMTVCSQTNTICTESYTMPIYTYSQTSDTYNAV